MKDMSCIGIKPVKSKMTIDNKHVNQLYILGDGCCIAEKWMPHSKTNESQYINCI